MAVAALIFGAVQAIGSVIGGVAKSNALKQNAGILDYNADVSTAEGEATAGEQLRQGDETASTIRARAGASGVVADGGSPLAVQAEAFRSAAYNARKTRYAASHKAWGFRSQAAIARFEAKQSIISGVIGAVGALGGSAIQAKGMSISTPTTPSPSLLS